MALERPKLFLERVKLSSELRRRRQAALTAANSAESVAVVLPSRSPVVKRTLFSLEREGTLVPPAQRAVPAATPRLAPPPSNGASQKRLRLRDKTVDPSWGSTANPAGRKA